MYSKVSSILLQYPKSPKVGSNWQAGALKGETFLTSVVAKHQKIEGEPFEEISKQKSHNAEKTEKGLGQMVHFDTIKFRRTFVELFRSVCVD